MNGLPSAVLFCCTMNAIRSPMAEAMLKMLHGRTVYVDSVGTKAGELDGFMVAVMEEIGLDLRKHRAKTFEMLEDTSFDLVIALSPQAQHKAVELTRHAAVQLEFWNTFDPSMVEGDREQRLEAYRQVRDELMSKIRKRFPLASVGGI
ncbi:MAG: arsenate reductase ArsC [Rhodospirillales bacterium]|nr:arsenate reductase ArsC [Rhodospirillales bacterium]